MAKDLTFFEKVNLIVAYACVPYFQEQVFLKKDFVDVWNLASEKAFYAFAKTISDILTETNTFRRLPLNLLKARVSGSEEYQETYQSGDAESYQQFLEIIKAVQDFKEEDWEKFISSLFKQYNEFVSHRKLQLKSEDFRDKDPLSATTEMYDLVSSTIISSVRESDFMKAGKGFTDSEYDRIPFGWNWVDDLCEGGIGSDEVMLYLQPSGGGKTVFGTNIAWHAARTGRHAAYLTYEQTISGDIANRFYALATGYPKVVFENRRLSQPDETTFEATHTSPEGRMITQSYNVGEVKAKIVEAQNLYGRYFHPYDMSTGDQGFDGMSDVINLYRQSILSGQRVELIVVDWLQTLVQNYMAKRSIQSTELTAQMNNFVIAATRFCRDEKVQMVILQQLDNQSQTKMDVKQLSHVNAANSKSLGNYCRIVLVASKFNEYSLGKVRRSKGTTLSNTRDTKDIKLYGAFNRIEEATREDLEAASVIDPDTNEDVGGLLIPQMR